MKKTALSLTAALFVPALLFVSCSGGSSDSNVAVTGVTLPETRFVQIGKTATLTASVQPSNATNKNVTWQSSNTGIATVNNGTVTGVAIGEAAITATTTDGNKTANCTVTVTLYDPVEEAARQREFERLSGEVKINMTTVVIRTEADYASTPNFTYDSTTHTVNLAKLVAHESVTDVALIQNIERINTEVFVELTAHEYHHAANSKYVNTIKEQKNLWKAMFLDETSAYTVQEMLASGNVFGTPMDSYTSPDKATELLFARFNAFARLFDGVSGTEYGYGINRRAFAQPNPTLTSYDTPEWFNTALNAMFTYEIGGKDVNLFALMTPADQQAFLKKLNDKCEEEYAAWLAGH